MQIIKETVDFQIEGKNAVAIGKFDGIHVGHRKLLQKISQAKQNGMAAVVFTFDPSPEELFQGIKLPVLDTKDEKRRKIEEMGVDYLIEFPLTLQTAAIPPEEPPYWYREPICPLGIREEGILPCWRHLQHRKVFLMR